MKMMRMTMKMIKTGRILVPLMKLMVKILMKMMESKISRGCKTILKKANFHYMGMHD